MNDETIDIESAEGGPMAMPLNRRTFLVAGGLGAAAVAFVGATGGISGATTQAVLQAPMVHAKKGSSTSTDLATAAVAAGLEVLAVATYKAALDAATANKLGPVPPAGANFIQTAIVQHQAHLDKWNQVLTGAGKPAVTTPNATLKPVVDQQFALVKDFAGAAKLARTLEETAAATYLKASPLLKDPAAIALAGSIQVIDAQHVAILNYVLGEYPVPDVFAKTDKAAS